MRLKILAVALLTASACARSSSPVTPSQGLQSPLRFSGTVSALQGGHIGGPIAGAEFTVVKGVNLNAKTVSDSTGHYVFDMRESGRFTFVLSAPGYASTTPIVDLYRDMQADFVLKAQ